MKHIGIIGSLMASLCIAALPVAAEEAHQHHHAEAATGEQTLTGEVIDAFCYLSHSETGQGGGHAACARKCIEGGLPVAIKVGDQLYLATMTNHEPANKVLGPRAGQQVTVHGTVLERDGQYLIAISKLD